MTFTIYLIQAVAFLDLLAVGLIVPLVAGHVRQMGGNHLYVGLLGSIYAGFQLGSGPFIGSLSDLKGRKTILILTLLVCGVAYTVLGLTNSIFIIMVIRAVLGLFKQTQMLTKALVPDYERNEQKQAEIYGKMAAISGAGITLGPIIGGHIAEDNPNDGFTLIAIIVGLCFAINSEKGLSMNVDGYKGTYMETKGKMWMNCEKGYYGCKGSCMYVICMQEKDTAPSLVYFLPKVEKKVSKSKDTSKEVQSSLIKTLYSSVRQSFVEMYYIEWSKYWDIFMFKALIGFAMGVYYSNYSLYLKTEYQLSPKYIGYVISFQGVIGSISSFFIGYINSFYVHDKDYSIRNFHVFLLTSISLTGLSLSFNVIVYTFWLIPLAIGNAIGRLVTLEMVLKRGHGDHRGTLIGASNSVRSLSGVVAPMVSGFIGQFYGVSYVIYASLCSTMLGVVLSYQHKNKTIKVD